MELVEIIPGLWMIPSANGGRFPFPHGLLVEGATRVLIDAGCGLPGIDELRTARPVDYVISSHSHPDHTALNWKFAGRPLFAPQYAADTFGDFEVLGERFLEPGPLASEWRGFVTSAMEFKTARPTHTFGDGHVFDFGRLSLVAVHTPGHTCDHMCFFEPTHGVLLSIDIDLSSFGPWYAHRESDIDTFERSMHKVMALDPRIVVSSHKGIITEEIPERLQRFWQVVESRDQVLLDSLPLVNNLEELTDLSPFYQGRPRAGANLLRYWEKQMIRKHLVRLAARGAIDKRWAEDEG